MWYMSLVVKNVRTVCGASMDTHGCLLLYAQMQLLWCSLAFVHLAHAAFMSRYGQANTATAYMCVSSPNNAPAFNTSFLMVNHSCCMTTIADEQGQDEMAMRAAPAELCRMVLTS